MTSVERDLLATLDPAARFNDTHTHAEVLSLLDDVIAKLGEQEYGTPLPSLPMVDA